MVAFAVVYELLLVGVGQCLQFAQELFGGLDEAARFGWFLVGGGVLFGEEGFAVTVCCVFQFGLDEFV